MLSLNRRFHSSSYPHWAGAFQRTQRSNPAPLRDFRTHYCEERYDSLLLSAPLLLCPVCLDPFALCRPLSDSLGGRHSTDYYGSAAPAEILATCPPTRFRGISAGSGVAHQAVYLSTVGALPLPLSLTSQAGKQSIPMRSPYGSLRGISVTMLSRSLVRCTWPKICFHHPVSHLFIGRVRRA